MYYADQRPRRLPYGQKRFGDGNGQVADSTAGFGLYTYPSYLGIDIVTLDRNSMPDELLGFTDGRRIAIKQADPVTREFVLLHEEEHVKDMGAGEREIDRRAFRRLLAKGADERKIGAVLALLEKRWRNPEQFAALIG